ncbi:MAG: DMT family transporter [Neisseria sp.]|nr:DMT family transporter [Neisseria sp.]
MDETKKDPLGSAWMIIAALLFTVMNVVLKAANQQFGYQGGELVFWRMVFSVAVLGGMALAQGKTFRTPHIKAHLNRSISGTVAMLCIFYAIVHLPLATGVTLSYTSSIFLALLSLIVLREKISWYTQAVLVFGFAGVVLLLNPSFQNGQELAGIIGLFGGLLSGWAYLQVRELSLLGEPGWRVVFYFSAVGMLIAAAWASWQGWTPLSWAAAPYLLAIGASAMLAQLAMTRAYKVGQKFTVASLAYLTVVFSSLTGVFLFGDVLDWREWLGMAVIIASGILSGLKK